MEQTPSSESVFEVKIETHRGHWAREDYDSFIRQLKKEGVSQRYRSLSEGDDDTSLVSYIAKVAGTVVGVAVGEGSGKRFNGKRLIVHPAFRKTNVGDELINAPLAEGSNFEEMVIEVGPIEGRAMVHDELLFTARQKLKARYTRAGFEEVPAEGTRLHMTRRKSAI